MLKPGYPSLILLPLLLATGCATSPTRHAGTPPDWEMGKEANRQPGSAPISQSSKPASPDLSAWLAGADGWVALDRWTEMNRLSPASRYTTSALATYVVSTAQGVLILKAGNRTAFWNGMAVQLGFVPREQGGKLLLHVLDLRKNLQPLMETLHLPPWGQRVVVIDPGHGGGNKGTRSTHDQRWEKEFTLDWALRLGPVLATNGWKVFYTRTNDIEVPLSKRVEFAEQQHADLFLSLHFNASPNRNPDQTGLETYCITPQGMPSNLVRDYEDDSGKTFPNNAFDAQNLQYAVRLHRALLAVNSNQDRGVRRARFMGVLQGQNRPAVLVEGGYLSNPAEAEHIATGAYRQALAEAVAKVLR